MLSLFLYPSFDLENLLGFKLKGQDVNKIVQKDGTVVWETWEEEEEYTVDTTEDVWVESGHYSETETGYLYHSNVNKNTGYKTFYGAYGNTDKYLIENYRAVFSGSYYLGLSSYPIYHMGGDVYEYKPIWVDTSHWETVGTVETLTRMIKKYFYKQD
jgi:hypothetical protein